jgi:hypothetical protein
MGASAAAARRQTLANFGGVSDIRADRRWHLLSFPDPMTG